MPSVYTLTSLTGRNKNAGRTMLIQGFEVGRRTILVLGAGLAIALMPSWVAWQAFGMYGAVFTPIIIIGGFYWLIEGRSRKGLQLRVYQTIQDKRKADTSTFFICWRPVGEALGASTIVAASELAPIPAADRPDPIYTSPNRPKHRNRTRR